MRNDEAGVGADLDAVFCGGALTESLDGVLTRDEGLLVRFETLLSSPERQHQAGCPIEECGDEGETGHLVVAQPGHTKVLVLGTAIGLGIVETGGAFPI